VRSEWCSNERLPGVYCRIHALTDEVLTDQVLSSDRVQRHSPQSIAPPEPTLRSLSIEINGGVDVTDIALFMELITFGGFGTLPARFYYPAEAFWRPR
jgi:hypothetical protein